MEYLLKLFTVSVSQSNGKVNISFPEFVGQIQARKFSEYLRGIALFRSQSSGGLFEERTGKFGGFIKKSIDSRMSFGILVESKQLKIKNTKL